MTRTWNEFVGKPLATVLLCIALVHTAHAQSRFTYNATGDEVLDTQTGLTWKRCSEGQTWYGRCGGPARGYTHEQALIVAKNQVASAWRVPSAKELRSITDRNWRSPAIDTEAFPDTAQGWYWTSSPIVVRPSHASAIAFHEGGFPGRFKRDTPNYVRLVR